MRIHIIEAPFFSREGQFKEGSKTLCVGIAVSSLRNYGEYRIYIGKNKEIYYDISYEEALGLYKTHGQNAIWEKNNKKVFIIPLSSCRIGKKQVHEVFDSEENTKLYEKNDKQLDLF